MLEEHAVTLAQVVLSGVAVTVFYETVLGALAVARKQPFALATLFGQRLAFQFAEPLLLVAIQHLGDGLLAYVAKAIFGKHEMVARVDIAVKLHHAGMATLFGINADAWCLAHPVGQDAIEQLDVCLSHIMTHPLVEDGAQEASPLLWRHREVGKRSLIAVCQCGEMSPVVVVDDALHDGRYLDILAAVVFKEMVEIERIVGVKVVNHRHGVPFNIMLIQELALKYIY